MLTHILRRKGCVQLRVTAIRDPNGHVIERHYIVAVAVRGLYVGSELGAGRKAAKRRRYGARLDLSIYCGEL